MSDFLLKPSAALAKHYDRLLVSMTVMRLLTDPEPETRWSYKPLMRWEHFYLRWLVGQIEAKVQEVHDRALSLGAYCNHDDCGW